MVRWNLGVNLIWASLGDSSLVGDAIASDGASWSGTTVAATTAAGPNLDLRPMSALRGCGEAEPQRQLHLGVVELVDECPAG